jgi:hypothetical protein
MSVFLAAMFHEARKVKIGLLARISQILGIGKKQERNTNLLELACGLSDEYDNVVVITPRKELDSSHRLAGGTRL